MLLIAFNCQVVQELNLVVISEFVPNLARAAVASGVDGLFFEVHDNPEEALSDGPNMLYLDQFEAVLRDLVAIDKIVKG